ncbi:MAG: tetratricopeptide repeat protein [Myxococcota bacterium]
MSHPNTDSFELIDTEREGALDAPTARRLELVLKNHWPVALEREWMFLFDDVRDEVPGDDDVDDLVEAVLARFEAKTPTVAMNSLSDGRAKALLARPDGRPAPLDTRQAKAIAPETTTRQWLALVGARSARSTRWVSAAVVLLAIGTGWTARGLVGDPPSASPVVATKALTESPPPLSANQVFARAELAYNRGATQRAVRLYRRVIRRYPRSDAARLARLALARTLLDDLAAPEEAAAAFATFLDHHPSDALAQDAAVGHAEALERTGEDATQTWRSILQRFPNTPAATIASRRLR